MVRRPPGRGIGEDTETRFAVVLDPLLFRPPFVSGSTKEAMTAQRVTLGVCMAIVAGSWAVCWWVYHANGGGTYNAGFFLSLIALATLSTAASVALIVRSWRGSGRLLLPVTLSLVTVLEVLVLALAIYARD